MRSVDRAGKAAALLAAVLAVLVGAAGCGRGGARQTGDTTSAGSGPAGSAGQTAEGAPRPGMDRGRTARETKLRVGGVEVTAEIADNDALRQRGLMERDSLPKDHGMLFVYPQAQVLSFWMHDTPLPLSIAFIDPDGTIADIQKMAPLSDSTHESSRAVMYALEMRQGWFEEHGVRPGDRVRF